MSRSLFLIITAILGLLFGLVMLATPQIMAGNIGFEPAADLHVILRAYGTAILGIAVANYVIRNEPDSTGISAVLWANVTFNGLLTILHVYWVAIGTLTVAAAAPGQVANLFMLFGSIYYIRKMGADA